MPVIYFIRHGETDWNVARRFQGQLDIPINDRGRAQAARNGQVLRELIGGGDGFDFVASPLSRTRETMDILRGQMGLAANGYRVDDRLREINKADWQGFLWAELGQRFPEQMAAYEAARWTHRPSGVGGESHADMHERVRDWLVGVTADTVVVSHGGPMRCIRRHLLDLDDTATLALAVPQDRIMCIRDGAVSWL